MQFDHVDQETVALSGLNLFLCELLRRIPSSADPRGSEEAEARIYSAPIAEDEDPAFQEDWAEYVRPELQEHFRSAMQVVEGDLEHLSTAEESTPQTLRIPTKHLESWINGLNQARLALAARFHLAEKDMRRFSGEGTLRDLAIIQIEVYAQLQEWFIEVLSGDSEPNS